MNLEFHRLALTEYERARRWYARRNETLARRFVYAVDDAVLRIASAPESHPSVSPTVRWVRVRRFPYRILIEQDADDVFVLAVSHTSRRPGY